MKKIVILKGSFIDSLEDYVLRECLKIMFPECEIKIRSDILMEESSDGDNDCFSMNTRL